MTRTVDRYVMKHTLGKGGFGKVKYGVDPLTNQAVALKIIRGTPGTIPSHIVPTPISAAKTSANDSSANSSSGGGTTNGATMMSIATTTNTTDKSAQQDEPRVSTTMSEMPANGGTRFEVLMREVEILRQLNHPRITRVLDVVPRAAYEKANGTFEEMMLIVMELAESGDLHDLILLFQEQGMGELVARTYFHQLLDGVLYCHRRGVVHLDLKPENIFLDHAFQLKIGDFGLARVFDPSTRLMRTPCGTRQFASPEVFSQQGYDGCAADIWSCATILFCMVAGNPPFALPARTDWWFDKLLTSRIELFWKGHPRSDRFTPEFKDFIIAMLQPAPQQRMTLEKMLAHPWFTGPVLHPNTLYQYITSRKLQRAMPTPADSTDEGSLEGTAGGGSEEVYRSVQGEESASLDDLPPRPPMFYTTQTSLPMTKPMAGKHQQHQQQRDVEPGAAVVPGQDSGYDDLTPEQLAAYQLPPDDDDENVYRDGAFGSAFSQLSIQQQQQSSTSVPTSSSSLAQAREGPLTEDAILAALPTSVQSLPAVLESVTTIPCTASLSVLFIELHRFFNSLHQSIVVVYEPSACAIRVRLVGHESKFVVQLHSAPALSSSTTAVWVSFRREFGNRAKFLRLFDDTLQHFRKLHLVHNEDAAASERTAEKATPETVAALRERFLKEVS